MTDRETPRASDPPRADARGRAARVVAATVAAGAVAAAITLLATVDIGLDQAAWAQRIRALIGGHGAIGVAVSIGLMVVHSFVPFPAEFVAIANGMVYGAVWGTVVTWCGAMLGAFAAFGLARAFGRPFVRRMVARRHWRRLDAWTADEGWRVLLISRLIPVIAFNLINYAAGLTGVSWLTFAWTTGVGILPVTVLMVLTGDNIDLMTWEWWLLILAAALVLSVVARRRFRV